MCEENGYSDVKGCNLTRVLYHFQNLTEDGFKRNVRAETMKLSEENVGKAAPCFRSVVQVAYSAVRSGSVHGRPRGAMEGPALTDRNSVGRLPSRLLTLEQFSCSSVTDKLISLLWESTWF